MKYTLLLLCLLFIISCGENKQPVPAAEVKSQTTVDSSHLQANIPLQAVYQERARLDLPRYLVIVKSKYSQSPEASLEDSSFYLVGNFIFVFDKSAKKTDSAQLEMSDPSPGDLALEDLSDSLHFKTLVIHLSWRGDSDMEWDEYVEHGPDSMHSLFSTNQVVKLERKDQWTLTGLQGGQDELVSAGQFDYPFTVSLKDGEITEVIPDVQQIGWYSKALAPIKGYRMLSPHDSIPYTIKKGTEFDVDTLYRPQKIVRLVIKGSIIIHVKTDNLEDKLTVNGAG